MKKALVAVAALSMMGLTWAQSSVDLYGIADFWVGKAKGGGAKSGSGGLAASRWGIKGTEDLGGGLSAGFVLEQVFDLASGASTDTDCRPTAWPAATAAATSADTGDSGCGTAAAAAAPAACFFSARSSEVLAPW